MEEGHKNPFEREREICFEALEKVTKESRVAYLEDACGEDAAMLARVREMLENHLSEDTDSFLAPPNIHASVGTLMNNFTPTSPLR